MGIAADFVLIMLAGFVGGLLARAARLPLLVGYVAAGIAVGPYTAGPTVVAIHDVELLAEIGVALLLFSLGLEVSFSDLNLVRKFAIGGGIAQISLTVAAGALFGYSAFGMTFTESLWFGAMISVSSTMVVLKSLAATGTTATLASRAMIGLLVMQDLAVIPMLIILPQLGNLDGALGKLARALGIAAVFLGLLVLLGTRILPRVLRQVLKLGSQELFIIAVVSAGVGAGYVTYLSGLSFALGAFVAGIILSESEFSHQALSDVAPLRDVFGLLFFVSIGMLLDPQYALSHWRQIIPAILAIFAGKAMITGGLARAFGYTFMAPWIIGLGLSQIGEFSFVLARTGLSIGALSQDTYNLALTCTILTMALSPIVTSAALPLGRAWRKWRNPGVPMKRFELPAEPLTNHVVIAGYGRTGQAAGRVLRAANIPLIVVDSKYDLMRNISEAGLSGVWGDSTREEVLRAAWIARARLLLLAVSDQAAIELTAARAREMNPRIIIIARAVREHHLAELRKLGVDSAVQPEFEGGVEMVRQALDRYQFDGEEGERLLAALRADVYGSG